MKPIFILLLLLIAYPSIGQVASKDPKAVSNHVMIKMLRGEEPFFLERKLPAQYEVKVDKALSKSSDIWLLKFNDKVCNTTDVINELLKINSVLYAQEDRFVELREAPNDPQYTNQWHHQNIDSELAWEITTGGQTAGGHDIVVALIESADLTHNDLTANHWKNQGEIPGNGIDDDGNGYVDDYNGWNVSSNNDNIGTGSHGTSCAGMIGATGNNGVGVTGINWSIKIMDIAGYNSPFTESNIISAYNYALQARIKWNQTNGEEGAFVVATSASWGVDGGNPNSYPIWCSFYDDLGEAGILNLGATTNNNWNVDNTGDVPTGCESQYMIGVTATNSNDVIDFAGYGVNTIDVAAPGSSVRTTAPNNGYTTTSGTSFACPLTAGLVGLLYSAPCSNIDIMAITDPQGTADMVRNALINGVDQTAHLIQRVKSGGRINAKNSLDLLMEDICNSCMSPSGISTSSIGENNVTIVFNTVEDVEEYTISIRESGTTEWTEYLTSDNTLTISNLTNCTRYEYKISSACNDDTDSPSSVYNFKTIDCGNCIDLTYCTVTANNGATAFSIKNPAPIAGNYSYVPTSNFGGTVGNGYAYGELVLVNDGSSNPTEGCNALVNAAEINGNIAVVYRGTCNFADKALRAQNAGATAVVVINNVAGQPIEMGGNNNSVTIPAIMISQANGNTIVNAINNNEKPYALLGKQNEWIEKIEINGTTYTSGDDNGYRLHESNLPFQQGEVQTFKLTPGFAGQGLPELTRVWVDLNQDGSFSNAELVYDQATPSTGEVTGNFTIPTNATLGSTRMRVQMSYQGDVNSSLPSVCNDFLYGEIEDFCVEITGSNLGISSDEIEKLVNIYPNPANDFITINTKFADLAKVIIYTSTGQKLTEESLLNGNSTIDVKNWSTGIYYFHIYNKDGALIATHKVSVTQ